MTDTFIVDRAGDFVVGKAQSTPDDESEGFMASTRDALGYWGAEPEQAMPGIVSGIYSGTAMLNRLLERKGRRVGVIVTGGMADGLRLERGIEAYAAEPSRRQLERVRDATRRAGAAFDLRVMAAHGGTISIEARQLARTLISGPIGGVIGARHLVEQLAAEGDGAGANVVCTDIGGTSFDIALITDGDFQIRQIPD